MLGLIGALLVSASAPQACEPQQCGSAPASGTCPAPSNVEPNLVLAIKASNLYFFNAAPHPVSVNYVTEGGLESPVLRMAPGIRREVSGLAGEVWRARAIRPGHPADQQLMLEHRVGLVSLKNCDCPQPEFVDCQKPPFKGPRKTKIDPVVFVNDAGVPLDLFYWNGTCEENVSWDEIGGVAPSRVKSIRSTHGHTFRARSSVTQQMLMQHTLSDIVIRPCDANEQDTTTPYSSPRAMALARATADLAREQSLLLDELESELARASQALQSALTSASFNASLDQAQVPNVASLLDGALLVRNVVRVDGKVSA